MIKLSIIVPVYNVEKYLVQCIDSILLQSYKDFELILVNDGSTDDSPEICDALSNKDQRIKVIHKSNGGLVSARQIGVKASQGFYIGHVDSDDWVEPNMFELLIEAAEKNDADIVICGLISNYTNREVYQQMNIKPGVYYPNNDSQFINHMLYYKPFFNFGISPNLVNKLFKKDIYESYQNNVDQRITIGEDLACSIPCILNSNKIIIINEHLYHYRRINTSMTNTYRKNMHYEIECLYNYLRTLKVVQERLNTQMPYYFAYLITSLIKNELSNKERIKLKDKILRTQNLGKSDYVRSTLKSIDWKEIPLRKKTLLKAIDNSQLYTLLLVFNFIRKFAKIKKKRHVNEN